MATDKGKPTVLTFALVTNNVELFELLINQGANVNELDRSGRTLAHWAVACGRHTILTKLIERGANLSLRDHSGAHPLHYATQLAPVNQAVSMVQLLLTHIDGPDQMDGAHQTPLFWVSLRKDRLPVAKVLVEHGASVNVRNVHGMTVLHSAAGSDNSHFIQTVLDANCTAPVDSPDRNGFTPLFYAAANGSVDCLRLLLDHGASVNHRSSRLKTVAHYCAARGDVDALKLLHSWGARLDLADEFGLTVLHEAVQSHNLACIKWLLRCVNDLNAFDCFGRTALHIAVALGDTAATAALLEHGADGHAVVHNKGQPIVAATVAARRHDRGTRQLLLHYAGAEPSAGNSTLSKHGAVKKCKSKIAGRENERAMAVSGFTEQKHTFHRHCLRKSWKNSRHAKSTDTETEQKKGQRATLHLPALPLRAPDRGTVISSEKVLAKPFTDDKKDNVNKKTGMAREIGSLNEHYLSNEPKLVNKSPVDV